MPVLKLSRIACLSHCLQVVRNAVSPTGGGVEDRVSAIASITNVYVSSDLQVRSERADMAVGWVEWSSAEAQDSIVAIWPDQIWADLLVC